MPVVPISKRVPVPQPQVDPNFLEIAAATMHKEGKINLTGNQNDAPSIPIRPKTS